MAIWHGLPLDEWPTVDRKAWVKVMTSVPKPSFSEPQRRLRQTTLRVYAQGYGSWLAWLDRNGRLDPPSRPEDRVNLENLEAYLEDMKSAGFADLTIAGRLHGLHDILRLISPKADIGFIAVAARRLRAVARRQTSIADRMQSPQAIHKHALALMGRARDISDIRHAVDYRDGLLLALWVTRATRISNLTNLAFGSQLLEQSGHWRVEYQPWEMKGGARFTFDWPASLIEPLVTYIEHVRPMLLAQGEPGDDHRRLWISIKGNPMSSVALRKVIQTRTREEFGLPMNPHHIRHSVATEVAELTPENVMDIPAMLAHSASETSERYYNLAGPARAAMKLAEEVEKIRRAERQPRIRRSDAEELIENPLWTLLGRSPR